VADGVTVTGEAWNSFSELEAIFPGYFNPGFYGTSDPSALPVDSGSGSDAFMLPEPVLLPEVIVTPRVVPPPPAALPPAPEPFVPPATLVGSLAAGVLLLLFPQPTGPAEFDEAPTPPQKPPGTPTSTDPLQPPNWDDLGGGGDSGLLDPVPVIGLPVPVPPVEMPPGERFFDVVGRPFTWTDIPGLEPFFLTPTAQPIEVPYGSPFESPAADPGPGSAPLPIGTPGSDPFPGLPLPDPAPGTRPAPEPTGTPSPDPLGTPVPDIIGDPFADPFVTPSLPIPPRTTPRAPDTSTPSTIGDPFLTTLDEPTLVEFQPRTLKPDADQCSCAKPKKKEKKKPSDRDECWKGTYVQRKRGISYVRKEQVPCEAKPRAARKRKGKTKTWKETIDEVFQI
jgi:hypothetical protein